VAPAVSHHAAVGSNWQLLVRVGSRCLVVLVARSPGRPVGRVRTFCTVSRRPAGPLAPPPRHARLRSRWRSRYGGATPVGWRESMKAGPLDLQRVSSVPVGVPPPAAGIVRDRSEPVKAVCDRRPTAPVELPGQCTREDGLDRTCPGPGIGSYREQGHEWPGTVST
jgi:hypothetical protein